MEEKVFYRGQIYYANLWKGGEAVQKGSRPVIIVSNNVGNAHSKIVTVVPITSRYKPSLPTHFEVWTGKVHGTALCEQVTTMSKEDVGDCVGCISRYYVELLNKCLLAALDLRGEYNNGAPPIEDMVVQQQLEKCAKMKEQLEKELHILDKLSGKTVEIEPQPDLKVPKKKYNKRSKEEIQEFLKEWEMCSSSTERMDVAEAFGFSSTKTAAVFYSRHSGV